MINVLFQVIFYKVCLNAKQEKKSAYTWKVIFKIKDLRGATFSTQGSGKQVSMTVIGHGHQVALWWHAWRGEKICRPWSKVFEMYCSDLAVPSTSWRGAIWQENQGHSNSDMGFSVLLGTLRGYLVTLQQAFLGQDALCSSRLPGMAMTATQDSISLGHLSAQLNTAYWNPAYPRNGAPSVGTNQPTQWSWV